MLAIFSLVVAFLISASGAKDLPPYFPRCHRDDPNLNKCLINATEQVRPYLIKGIPEVNIPSIDPFKVPEIVLEQGTSALNFKATLHDMNITGLSNYVFSQFDFDVPNLEFYCKINIDRLYLHGIYSIVGKILLAPIAGKGNFYANATNMDITLYQKAKIVKRKGVEYMQPTNTTTEVKLGDAKARLDGLFDGNELLARATNDIINDNIKELFHEIKPVIEKVVTNIVEDILLKSLSGNIPYDKLYPTTSKSSV